ncbi:hypothetical protein L083_1200 [Actinoplanes sp. N902-109]|nr:hypothetical protein L083_1200 [Actinoplanes sp. N902-109]
MGIDTVFVDRRGARPSNGLGVPYGDHGFLQARSPRASGHRDRAVATTG